MPNPLLVPSQADDGQAELLRMLRDEWLLPELAEHLLSTLSTLQGDALLEAALDPGHSPRWLPTPLIVWSETAGKADHIASYVAGAGYALKYDWEGMGWPFWYPNVKRVRWFSSKRARRSLYVVQRAPPKINYSPVAFTRRVLYGGTLTVLSPVPPVVGDRLALLDDLDGLLSPEAWGEVLRHTRRLVGYGYTVDWQALAVSACTSVAGRADDMPLESKSVVFETVMYLMNRFERALSPDVQLRLIADEEKHELRVGVNDRQFKLLDFIPEDFASEQDSMVGIVSDSRGGGDGKPVEVDVAVDAEAEQRRAVALQLAAVEARAEERRVAEARAEERRVAEARAEERRVEAAQKQAAEAAQQRVRAQKQAAEAAQKQAAEAAQKQAAEAAQKQAAEAAQKQALEAAQQRVRAQKQAAAEAAQKQAAAEAAQKQAAEAAQQRVRAQKQAAAEAAQKQAAAEAAQKQAAAEAARQRQQQAQAAKDSLRSNVQLHATQVNQERPLPPPETYTPFQVLQLSEQDATPDLVREQRQVMLTRYDPKRLTSGYSWLVQRYEYFCGLVEKCAEELNTTANIRAWWAASGRRKVVSHRNINLCRYPPRPQQEQLKDAPLMPAPLEKWQEMTTIHQFMEVINASPEWSQRFRLTKALGNGAFGVVYQGYRLADQSPFAAKLCVPLAEYPLWPFHQEFLLLDRLQTKMKDHIVRVYPPGFMWFGLPGLGYDCSIQPAQKLSNAHLYRTVWGLFLQELYDGDGDQLAWQRTLPVFEVCLEQCVVALQKLHEQFVVHRDVKLGNFLFRVVNGRTVVALSDLGLASDEALPRAVELRRKEIGNVAGAVCKPYPGTSRYFGWRRGEEMADQLYGCRDPDEDFESLANSLWEVFISGSSPLPDHAERQLLYATEPRRAAGVQLSDQQQMKYQILLLGYRARNHLMGTPVFPGGGGRVGGGGMNFPLPLPRVPLFSGRPLPDLPRPPLLPLLPRPPPSATPATSGFTGSGSGSGSAQPAIFHLGPIIAQEQKRELIQGQSDEFDRVNQLADPTRQFDMRDVSQFEWQRGPDRDAKMLPVADRAEVPNQCFNFHRDSVEQIDPSMFTILKRLTEKEVQNDTPRYGQQAVCLSRETLLGLVNDPDANYVACDHVNVDSVVVDPRPASRFVSVTLKFDRRTTYWFPRSDLVWALNNGPAVYQVRASENVLPLLAKMTSLSDCGRRGVRGELLDGRNGYDRLRWVRVRG